MTVREQRGRLAVQRAYPEHFVSCRWCPVGRQCPQCLGTRRVTKATARELAGERESRAVA